MWYKLAKFKKQTVLFSKLYLSFYAKGFDEVMKFKYLKF